MSELLTAVSLLTDLAQAASRISGNMLTVSSIVLKAQSEGRDKLTPDEWEALEAIDDKASADLVALAKLKSQA